MGQGTQEAVVTRVTVGCHERIPPAGDGWFGIGCENEEVHRLETRSARLRRSGNEG